MTNLFICKRTVGGNSTSEYGTRYYVYEEVEPYNPDVPCRKSYNAGFNFATEVTRASSCEKQSEITIKLMAALKDVMSYCYDDDAYLRAKNILRECGAYQEHRKGMGE
jgi:hypothetical protein